DWCWEVIERCLVPCYRRPEEMTRNIIERNGSGYVVLCASVVIKFDYIALGGLKLQLKLPPIAACRQHMALHHIDRLPEKGQRSVRGGSRLKNSRWIRIRERSDERGAIIGGCYQRRRGVIAGIVGRNR